MPPVQSDRRSTRLATKRKRSSTNKGGNDIGADVFTHTPSLVNIVPSTTESGNGARTCTSSGSSSDVWSVVQTLADSVNELKEQLTILNNKVSTCNTSQEQSNFSSSVINVAGATGQGMDTGNSTLPDMGTHRLYQHHSVPLGATVPESIKRQIWANDFVELGLLLPESLEKALKPKNIVLENFFDKNVLSVKEHNTTISSLDLWQTAFSVYMSIYIEKHPTNASGMLKYMEVVREIAKKKGNWWFYDNKFRSTKSQLSVSWGVTHQELYVEALLDRSVYDLQNSHVPTGVSGISNKSLGKQPLVPFGYCVKFHAGTYCPLPCRYSHHCYKCGKFHASIRCFVSSTHVAPPNRMPLGQGNTVGGRSEHSFRQPRAFYAGQRTQYRGFRPRTSNPN